VTERRRERVVDRLGSADVTARRAGLLIGAFTLAATLVCGLLIWLVDRDEFPTPGSGMWWAVQTVTTVGYGDIVPSTVPGRVIATVIMVAGIGFLTVVTASITAVFVESARRRLARASGASVEERLDRIAERLDRIEQRLQAGEGPP
jgi:voltage-gated potassium channel